MNKTVKWLWRIGFLGIGILWFCILITFVFQEDIGKEAVVNTVKSGHIVNLKAITIGTPPEEGMDSLYEQLDALTIPELGCTLRFEFIPWGDERKQINIATASGEYDYIPGGVFSDYRTLVLKNAFLNLNDYLYLVPDLQKHYNSNGKDVLSRCEINGGVYGLPQYSNLVLRNINEGFFFREDLRKEWGLKPITDLETMEAYLYRAKEEDKYKDEPLITDNRIWTCLWSMLTQGKYLEISSTLETPFVVVEADNPYVPLNRLETPEFKEVLYYIKKWYKDGIIASDMLVASDNEGKKGLNLILADKKPCETNTPIWSCNTSYIPELYIEHPNWEFGFYDYTLDSEKLYHGSLAGNSVLSISSKTNNPEIAVKLLEKLHTDSRYYELLHYGVLGEHYKIEESTISYDDISTANRFPGWTAAADETLNYEEISVNPVWQKEVMEVHGEKALNKVKSAEYYPLDGFSLDTTSILKTMNHLDSVKEKYYQPLMCGVMEDVSKSLESVNDELISAGLDTYIEELSMQLEEFKQK